jgi:hypothetical protein
MEWRRLDERALAYARKELGKGKTLARACLAVLEDCEPWARLPRNMTIEEAYDFDGGGLAPSVTRSQLLPAETLWRFVGREDPGWMRIVVFEDPYARPSDPLPPGPNGRPPVAFLGDEVYQLIPPELAGDETHLPVAEYPIIGVASRVKAEPDAFDDRVQLRAGLVQELAAYSAAVLVGAWDAETYLVLDRGLLASNSNST